MEKLRAFIALPLPDNVADYLQGIRRELAGMGFDFRWVRQENVHLTLCFLGDISSGELPGVAGAMEAATAECTAFSLAARGIGFFPGVNRTRVLWVGVEGETQRLVAYQRRLSDLLTPHGFQRDKRPFRAHLTIARINTPIGPDAAVDLMERVGKTEAAPFTPREVILYQSELHRSGAVYHPLRRMAFRRAETNIIHS